MRVIRTKGSDAEDWTPRLCTHGGEPYAILSHRWLTDPDSEVLFADIEEVGRSVNTTVSSNSEIVIRNSQYAGTYVQSKPGFGKLRGAARQALKDGFEYVWIDTCCINKDSSAELSEAINSMWKWYEASGTCYVYLVDMPDVPGEAQKSLFAKCSWWTRGWTLQELLAPSQVTFFSATWTDIGRKKHMDMIIADITGIDPNIINGTLTLESISIAQRMSWASNRTTIRVEDTAYCLLGLFSVNMPLLYGEGEKAFLRLQYEIMKDSDDETIFAWKDDSIAPHVYSGLLARQPSAFADSGTTVRYQDAERRASYSMTNKGLAISLRIAQHADGFYRAMLHCAKPGSSSTQVSIYLKKVPRPVNTTRVYGVKSWHRVDHSLCHLTSRPSMSNKLMTKDPFMKCLAKPRGAYVCFESCRLKIPL